MKAKQTEAESFLKAFCSLSKSQRNIMIDHLMRDDEFGADLEDVVLIERARQEKGEDISLDEYAELRKSNR